MLLKQRWMRRSLHNTVRQLSSCYEGQLFAHRAALRLSRVRYTTAAGRGSRVASRWFAYS